MLKRILAAILAVTTVAALAGCNKKDDEISSSSSNSSAGSNYNYDLSRITGDFGGTKMPLAEEPTTLSWLVATEVTDLNEKFFVKEFEKLSNVKINYTTYPKASIAEKVSAMIASKKLLDIIGEGVEGSQINKFGMEGAFSALNDHLDVMPNFKKEIKDNDKLNYYMKSFAAPDNKVYTLAQIKSSRVVNHGMMYRKDIFDKHGLKMWNSPDEFYNVLKKLKELYPKSTPFASKGQKSIFISLGYSWGLDNAFGAFYDEAAKQWKFGSTTEAFKNELEFIRKCYLDGLFDPEFLTSTAEAWTAKMTSAEGAFVTWDWIDRVNLFKEQTKDTVPDYDLRYANPVGPTGQHVHLPDFSGSCAVVANNDKAELSWKVLDFMLSEAGANLQTLGVLNETYTIGEDGNAKYIGFDKKPQITDLEAKYGLFQQQTYKRMSPIGAYFAFTEKQQEAQDLIVKNNRLLPLDPTLNFTSEQNKKLADLDTNIIKKAEEFAYAYVMAPKGKDMEKMWADWLKQVEKMNVGEALDIRNQVQKEMYGN